MPNSLVLVVPRLLARSDQTLATMRPLVRLAAYARGVARSRDVARALLAALGMREETPIAPLALLGAGGDPGDDYVLCAAPVHLEAGAGHALDVAVVSDLAPADVDTLVRMLDRHFADDDLRFEARPATTWFARRTQASDVTLTPPDAVRGTTLEQSLPQGPDRARWRRWQDEIAMLLHDHPINRVREAANAPTVNAIWFFGAGRLRDVRDAPRVVVADARGFFGDVARGLARLPERDAVTTPGRTADGSAQPARGDRYVVVVGEEGAEEAALGHALAQLEARNVDTVQVLAGGRAGVITWRVPAPGAWRRIVARATPHAFRVPASPDR